MIKRTGKITTVFLQDKNKNLTDITWLVRECNINLTYDAIVVADCLLFEIDDTGEKKIDIYRKCVLKYLYSFPVISVKINEKEIRVVLDAINFVYPIKKEPEKSMWHKVLKFLYIRYLN